MANLEVCAASIESVFAAAEGGASRVELCTDLHKGGTTPPLSWVEYSLNNTDLQIFTLIRPRSGDFLYTKNEFNTMKRDIQLFAQAGCHGVVFGILTEDGKIDIERNNELISIAKKYSLSTTFHRAIDRTANIFDAMEDIIKLGFDRILTSGGKKSVTEGKEVIKKMIENFKDRIIIMPGGGVNENNITELYEYLRAKEFHGSFSKTVESKMKFRKEGIDSFENDFSSSISCPEKIRKTIELLLP